MNTLIIISCVCMIFVIGRIFIVPIKWIFKLIFNSIFGGILIWSINMIGGTWGLHIGLNIYTSLVVRFVRNSGCYCFDLIKVDCSLIIRNRAPHGGARQDD
jgi:inhibitor of the pro-sigma K processing machinery